MSIPGPTHLPGLAPTLILNSHSYCVHDVCMHTHTLKHTRTHTLGHRGWWIVQRVFSSPVLSALTVLECPSVFPLPHEICMFSRPCPDTSSKACPDIPLQGKISQFFPWSFWRTSLHVIWSLLKYSLHYTDVSVYQCSLVNCEILGVKYHTSLSF